MLLENHRQLHHTFFWILHLSGQYVIKKGPSEITLWHVSSVLYWLEIETNTKKHILTALLHISWVIKHSGTNFIVEG